MLKSLVIEPTKKTPGVNLSGGNLLLQGRSIISDTRTFYDPILAWICAYLDNPEQKTVFTLRLEYIDASSVQSIILLLKTLKEIRTRGLELKIKWYYEYGDLEMLQLGTILQDRLEMDFDFTEFEPENSGF